jgi:hypothetical protein
MLDHRTDADAMGEFVFEVDADRAAVAPFVLHLTRTQQQGEMQIAATVGAVPRRLRRERRRDGDQKQDQCGSQKQHLYTPTPVTVGDLTLRRSVNPRDDLGQGASLAQASARKGWRDHDLAAAERLPTAPPAIVVSNCRSSPEPHDRLVSYVKVAAEML